MKSAKRWSLLLLALGVPVGCAELIGADEPRELRKAPIATEAGSDVFAEVPDASFDAEACGPNEKRCDGTCVSKTDPAFGCNSEGCAPCNLPNAKTVGCDGKCVIGTCRDGFSDCKEPAKGCGFDLSAPETCTACGNNCVGSLTPLCTPTGCGSTCPNGTTKCGASCVDIKTHPKHCNGCGIACVAGANGDPGCANGTCLTVCRAGYGHCDQNPNGNCLALQTFYQDLDGDGFGDPKGPTKLGCPNQGGVGVASNGSDCNDANKDVFPGQQMYFPSSFKNAAGTPSFDYDCNGIETDRSNHFPGCGDGCSGSGVGPAGSGRTGFGVNDYCGSTNGLACTGGVLSPAEPFQQSRPMSSGAVTPSCEIKSTPIGANGCK